MRFVRYIKDGICGYARPIGKKFLRLTGDPYIDSLQDTEEWLEEHEISILAPSEPSKIVAVGKNYADHAAELDGDVPSQIVFFLKPPTSVIAAGENIIYPSGVTRLDYEGELAFIIKKKAKHVQASEAGEYILGYTILNDVTARDIQKQDVQWTRAKSYDTFCPIGPVVTDEVNPSSLAVVTRLNGEVKQQSNTKYFTWGIGEMLEFITSVMTLLPGDVITTGTPAGIGPMQIGDHIEVEIEGIGVLRNQVAAP